MWIYINDQLAYQNVESILFPKDSNKGDYIDENNRTTFHYYNDNKLFSITLVFEDSTKKDIKVRKCWINYPDYGGIRSLNTKRYYEPIKGYLYT